MRKVLRFEEKVKRIGRMVSDMLIKKNRSYGNSALSPVRIFSKSSDIEQIYVRIDDKLSRIKSGSSLGEDTIMDLIGYLFLLKIKMEESDEKRLS